MKAILASRLDIFILIITALVIISWNAGIKGLGAVNGILFVNLVPVISSVIGIFQGHKISAVEMCGMAITLVALMLNNICMRNNQQTND